MTEEEYNALTWPARIKMARMALPNATKTALSRELQVTVHTVINWEAGKCIPRMDTHKRIKELCLAGVSPGGSGINLDFLLGGFDTNERILTSPLITRNKECATLAMTAIACKLSSHIYASVTKTPVVISMDTVFNSYPSLLRLTVSPVNFPGVFYTITVTHVPAGTNYVLELAGSMLGKYITDVSDSNIYNAVRLIKKSINKLKNIK